MADQSPTGRTYGQVLAEGAAARPELIDTIQAGMPAVVGDLSVRSPFRRSTENALETFRRLGELEETMPDLARPATVAEEFGNRQMLHLMRLRLLGTFLRMLDAEITAGNLTPTVREQQRLLVERFESWCGQAEADSPGPPIELRKLVAVQPGAALTAAFHLGEGTA